MSFEDLLKRANQGDVNAQYEVGKIFYDGGDEKQAFKYCQLSANQNHPNALNRLGWHYSNGIGVVQNYKQAFKYYLLATEQKYKISYGNIGYYYETGKGVKKDLKKALEYYHLLGNKKYIFECELLILKQFGETLNETGYLYAYPLHIKHNHKDLEKLKTLINKKYVVEMYFIPSVLSDIIISFFL